VTYYTNGFSTVAQIFGDFGPPKNYITCTCAACYPVPSLRFGISHQQAFLHDFKDGGNADVSGISYHIGIRWNFGNQ